MFTTPSTADRYTAFASWLEQRVGTHKAAITINRYATVFADIGACWNGVPSYADLLQHFGAAGLRRFALPMRWLVEAEHIAVDGARKEADSERRRIARIVERVGTPEAQAVLSGYRDVLMSRAELGQIGLRSVRLALSPAAGLLMVAHEHGEAVPRQPSIRAFVQKTPGQRAALSGFIRYLRDSCGGDVTLPKPNGLARRKRRDRLERELIALLDGKRCGRTLGRRFVKAALEYFHDLPAMLAKQIAAEGAFDVDKEGMGNVTFDGRVYVVPVALPAEADVV